VYATAQAQEALRIVREYPSPVMCAACYQIGMLAGDEAVAG
jgi:hypothetical protein